MDLVVEQFDLEGENLYHRAQQLVGEEVHVVQNEITEEAYSVCRENPVSFDVEPKEAALNLLEHGHGAPLWPSGDDFVIITDPIEYEAACFANRHTPDHVTVCTAEDGYEIVDDFNRRGAMAYREKDVQYDQNGGFITRPWAEENPEQYIEILTTSRTVPPLMHCKFLSSGDVKELGFEKHNGQYGNGFYRRSRNDNPGQIREKLEEEGHEVIFLVTRDTPFETHWNTYIR